MIGDHRAILRRLLAALTASALLAPAALRADRGRSCPTGMAQVSVDGRVMWCAESREVRLVAEPVMERRHQAVAFAIKDRQGGLELVVVLIGGEVDGHTMTWELPAAATADRRGGAPTVMWLGKQRVGFGTSAVRPAVVASWTLSLGGDDRAASAGDFGRGRYASRP